MIKLIITLIKRLIRIILTPFAYFLFILTWQPKQIALWSWKLKNGYLNVWKTLLVNFSLFPLNIAKKLPIYIYKDVNFLNTGTIRITAEKIHPGMIKINALNWRSKSKTQIENHGTIIFKGNCRFFGGVNLTVLKSGNVSLGNECTICENVIIFSENSIKIGNRTDITFNSIVTDTNSHFTVSTEKGVVYSPLKTVEIGNFNWIGNNCSIKPGTKTPDHTIVASSYSVLTKDYTSTIKPYSIIGGCPAKLIKENTARVWDVDQEQILYNKLRKKEPLNINIEQLYDITNSMKGY